MIFSDFLRAGITYWDAVLLHCRRSVKLAVVLVPISVGNKCRLDSRSARIINSTPGKYKQGKFIFTSSKIVNIVD